MALHAELGAVDPAAAARIDPRNVRRVIRAIEVFRLTGRRFSEQQEETPPTWRSLTIGLTLPREELYRRIDRRYEEMIAAGWVDEVRALLARGYREDLPSMTSLGYREIARYLRGELSRDEALQRIKFQGHRYARQQYNLFRLDDPTIRWYEPGPTTASSVARLAEERLR
jgi:tRNA dimethylallyltransferase